MCVQVSDVGRPVDNLSPSEAPAPIPKRVDLEAHGKWKDTEYPSMRYPFVLPAANIPAWSGEKARCRTT